MRPLPSSSQKCSHVAHCGTSSEFAISTRGAPACVRNTPTGLPDWTSSVSSFSSRPQRGDDAVEGLPRARRLAGAAVDDEIVGSLGHLGIEVVHQHAQRGFLRPALARQRACRAVRAPGAPRSVEVHDASTSSGEP